MDITQRYTVTDTENTSAGVSISVTNPDDGAELKLLISHDGFDRLGCRKGDVLTEEEFTELNREAELNRAVSRTVKILSYSDHSKAQLVKKLAAYGFSKETAVLAAEEAVRRGYINEAEQATRAAVYYAKNKYWGKKRIAAELLFRGYERAATLSAIAAVTDEEYETSLMRIIKRKYMPLPEKYDKKAEMISSLCRLGYSASEINRVIEVLHNEE